MAPAIMGAPDQPELGVELTNSFCRTDPEIAKHFARVTFLSDNRADLPRLQTPTLILQCSDDLIAPLAVGEYMHRTLPQRTLRIIENVGHCPHLSAPSASARRDRRVPAHASGTEHGRRVGGGSAARRWQRCTTRRRAGCCVTDADGTDPARQPHLLHAGSAARPTSWSAARSCRTC